MSRFTHRLAAIGVAAVTAGCGSQPPDVPRMPEVPAGAEVGLVEVARLDQPIAMAVRAGDDALYVAERGGRVRALREGEVDPEPLVDIRGETVAEGERGLLGVTFSPDGTKLYLSYTDQHGDSRVDEWTLDGSAAVKGSRRTILALEQPYANHNGGGLAFGPDGLLYLAFGDGGAGGDPHGYAQSLDALLGKLLRIDPARDDAAAYSIPADNPFVDDPAARPEIWAYGLRNPWRFSFDSETGDLWIGDVGQGAVEEINFVPQGEGAGTDFGWNHYEGSQPFAGAGAGQSLPPIAEYTHEEGCSVTGGYVYRGQDLPALQGSYLYGDFCSGRILSLTQEGGEVTGVADLGLRVEQLASFGQDAEGELYALSLAGPVYRLAPP